MSDQPPDKQFWDLADSFINLANEHAATVPRSKVSATILYAAARFNAFVAAAASADEASLRQDRDKAIEYFTGQYQKMLGENLDDWAKHYSEYIALRRDANDA